MFLPRQYLPNTLRAPACLRPDYSIVTTPYSITLMLLSENTTHQPRQKPRKNLPTSPILGMTGRSRNDGIVKRASFLENLWPPLPGLSTLPLGRSPSTAPRHCPHQPPDQSDHDQNPEQVDSPTHDMNDGKQYQPDDKDRQGDQQQSMNHGCAPSNA